MAIDYTPSPSSINLKDGKLWKEILRCGEGDETPEDGVEVFVHYIGSLTDGSEFDRSDRKGKPFSFVLGKSKAIYIVIVNLILIHRYVIISFRVCYFGMGNRGGQYEKRRNL